MKNYFKYIFAIILIILFTISVVPKSFQNDTFYIIPLRTNYNRTWNRWY